MIRLVFDIGGTNMRMALAEDGKLQEVQKIPTPKAPEDALAQLTAFAEGKDVQEAVGGVAGIIKDGMVLDSPNLRSWESFALGRSLREALGVSVQVYNDAELAGIGEALNGAGKGHERVGYLALGTGVGGALVVAGEEGPRIEGNEPGRMVLDPLAGRTLESFVGGAALEAEFHVRPEFLAQRVYDERLPLLTRGIEALAALWMPDVFILNGPLVLGTPAFRIKNIDIKDVPLLPALHADESGLWGGALV